MLGKVCGVGQYTGKHETKASSRLRLSEVLLSLGTWCLCFMYVWRWVREVSVACTLLGCLLLPQFPLH